MSSKTTTSGLLPEVLEELPDRPEGLLDPRGGDAAADEVAEALGHERGVLVALEELRDPALYVLGRIAVVGTRRVSQDGRDRPERDAFAVGQAAPPKDSGVPCDPGEELAAQPRLAHAGGTHQRHERGLFLARASRQRPLEQRELIDAADERRVETARPAGCGRVDVEHPEGADGLALSLQRQRPDFLGRDRLPHEPVGRLADQDLPGLRGALETRGGVHGVSGDERLSPARVPGDHLAGEEARSERERHSPALAELLVQAMQRVPHLLRRAHRPQGVVLVDLRDPEDRHHRVADELLHHAAVALEHHLDLVEAAGDQPAHGLRVQLLSEAGRVGDIREEDGDDLAHLRIDRRRRGEPGRAPPAEASVRLVLGAALRTGKGHAHRRDTPSARPWPGGPAEPAQRADVIVCAGFRLSQVGWRLDNRHVTGYVGRPSRQKGGRTWRDHGAQPMRGRGRSRSSPR
jgi:hypothetical protein